MKKATVTSTMLFMFAASAQSDEIQSGLQPGNLATPFEVTDITGPNIRRGSQSPPQIDPTPSAHRRITVPMNQVSG